MARRKRAPAPREGSEILLSLCMIVRNEAQNLPRCLESVRGVVDEIVLVDTGSTDDSVAVAERFGARIFHYAWCDDFDPNPKRRGGGVADPGRAVPRHLPGRSPGVDAGRRARLRLVA